MLAERDFPQETVLPDRSLSMETLIAQLLKDHPTDTRQMPALNYLQSDRTGSTASVPLTIADTASGSHGVDVHVAANLDLEKPTTPICFEINGQQLTLPLNASLVIGRVSAQPDDSCPDVALNAFRAAEQGVSRQHLRITRKGEIVYVSDLGSTNGTCLNGRPLPRNRYRIVNSGDELQLGALKLIVKF
jgi:hypothetical protein